MSFTRTVVSIALGLGAAASASAAIIAASNPGSSDIGARIRWGATGFEASVYDSSPLNQNPQLNPVGTPAWQVGQGYSFQVTYDSTTGTIGLSVDFNRDSSFGAGESISRNTFATGNGLASYVGYGFNYLQVSGSGESSTNTARSEVTNLVINGTSIGTLTPNGALLDRWYEDSSGNPITQINITGTLTFLTAGAGQEAPSWNFRFIQPEQPAAVPEPASLALVGLALAGVGALRRRRA